MLLAIDVGIKHLAYCVTDLSGIIHHWSIVNLVEEQKKRTMYHVWET